MSIDTAIVRAGSSTEPIGTAVSWLDAQLGDRPAPRLVVLIGFDGAHLLRAVARRAPASRILVLDPDGPSSRTALADPDVQAWVADGRLGYLADPDYAGADEAWRLFPAVPDDYGVFVHPRFADGAAESAIRAARVLKRIVFGVRANADARRRFAPRYLTSSIRNLPAIAAGHDLAALDGQFTGVPAIIAAAGPSLDDAIEDLRAGSTHALLIAADTALRPLLAAGIEPPLVVAVDPGEANARHFHALPACPHTWLVAESALDPSALVPFDDRMFWCRVAHHHPWPWFNAVGVDVTRIDVWGSVLTAAFQVALRAGCDPIVIVGADLAYTGGRPYCRGTALEFEWAHAAAHGYKTDAIWAGQIGQRNPVRDRDLRGDWTNTTPVLQSFRDWMVARAAKCGRRVINATGAGILFGDGIEQGTLADAVRGTAPVRDIASIVTATRPADRGALSAHVHAAAQQLAAGRTAPPVSDWAGFLGEAFDPAAVAEALGDAATALEGRVPRHNRTPIIPWSMVSSEHAREVLTQAPEFTTRLADALAGRPPLASAPPAGEADVAERLREAFHLLVHLRRMAHAETELPPSLNEHALGHVPVGSACAWSHALSWPVRLFEALVGSTVSRSLPSATTSFVSRPVAPRDGAAGPPCTPLSLAASPDADAICRPLALEWLLAVAQRQPGPAQPFDRFATWLRAFHAALNLPGDGDARPLRSTLAVSVSGGSCERLEFDLAIDERYLARVLTGTVSLTGLRHRTIQLSTSSLPGLRVSLALRVAGGTAGPSAGPDDVLIRPRALTDEGIAPVSLAYTAAAGAICTRRDGSGSFVVREDGTTATREDWPRSITGELVLPSGVEVAWGVGAARWPEGGPGYVMWRRPSDGRVAIDDLPFGPSAATVSNGRVYWTCYPFGFASWAPGERPALEAADLSLYGAHADAQGIVLHPRVRAASGVTERRLVRAGVRITADGERTAFDLGRFGSATLRAEGPGWSAAAHPEADAVVLTSAPGRVAVMTFYHPYAVAWAGRSLLVTTAGGELLFFERLADVLSSWTESGSR